MTQSPLFVLTFSVSTTTLIKLSSDKKSLLRPFLPSCPTLSLTNIPWQTLPTTIIVISNNQGIMFQRKQRHSVVITPSTSIHQHSIFFSTHSYQYFDPYWLHSTLFDGNYHVHSRFDFSPSGWRTIYRDSIPSNSSHMEKWSWRYLWPFWCWQDTIPASYHPTWSNPVRLHPMQSLLPFSRPTKPIQLPRSYSESPLNGWSPSTNWVRYVRSFFRLVMAMLHMHMVTQEVEMDLVDSLVEVMVGVMTVDT